MDERFSVLAIAIAVAVSYGCVYDRGVAAEHGQTLAARDGWKARAI
ncbi:hypothetical protein BHAOGJBA_4151 [Methylobacterium hispanicum]|uniref:Uncharacterized protein n=1 Tax=Methylobacterium hispanicum TaxID=270350 RepID=A0AAV4ZR43_9HYPH|nr:hypothetical protein [Methylobacterium hispanicum]GJD90609.1 hypothetical protein BHAOGJBA_4151 [Methylobacterium hispanicum]